MKKSYKKIVPYIVTLLYTFNLPTKSSNERGHEIIHGSELLQEYTFNDSSNSSSENNNNNIEDDEAYARQLQQQFEQDDKAYALELQQKFGLENDDDQKKDEPLASPSPKEEVMHNLEIQEEMVNFKILKQNDSLNEIEPGFHLSDQNEEPKSIVDKNLEALRQQDSKTELQLDELQQAFIESNAFFVDRIKVIEEENSKNRNKLVDHIQIQEQNISSNHLKVNKDHRKVVEQLTNKHKEDLSNFLCKICEFNANHKKQTEEIINMYGNEKAAYMAKVQDLQKIHQQERELYLLQMQSCMQEVEEEHQNEKQLLIMNTKQLVERQRKAYEIDRDSLTSKAKKKFAEDHEKYLKLQKAYLQLIKRMEKMKKEHIAETKEILDGAHTQIENVKKAANSSLIELQKMQQKYESIVQQMNEQYGNK
ncbi:MAG: hypothetical protein AAF335_02985 [Bacteroidota bacterium]